MNNKQQERDNIQVSIRIKPMFEEGKTCIRIDPNLQNTIIIEGQQQQEQKFFSFDNVADQDAQQEDIFQMIGQQQASNCLEGYNGCVFVYGQTGSGKTYTMTGTPSQPGLLPRIIDYLYRCIIDDQTNDVSVEYLVKCSHLEIYNEHIIDLLNPDLGNLQLREDLNKGVYVEFLTEEYCANLVEAMEVLQRGNENRHISSTQMNFESSRSHSVFTIQLESRRQSHSLTNHRFSRFHFVDLAGSERQKHTQVQGERLREGCQINRSLHILGNVINSLVEDKEQNRYVHYRDSKLTFLLKDSLGGNSRTHLIATIQQSNLFYQETLSTLMFSKRVKQVKNKARVNEDETGSLESLKNEIKRLKQELAKWIVTLSNNPNEQPNKVNNVIQSMNFQDLVASDSKIIKLEEILKVYLEQSTESETALFIEIEKYLSGIKELREAFQLSSQLEQQLKLIIRLQNEQIIRLKHSNGIEDLSNDYEQELSKALLSQAAVMKKFSDSLRIKEGSAKTVEKAKLQINENVQLLNNIVSTVNGSLEERKKFQKQLQTQLAQDYVPAQEFTQINLQLQQKIQQEEQIKQSLDQIGIQLDIQDQIKVVDHKQRDLTLGQQNEQLEIKSRALDAMEKQVTEKNQQIKNLEEIKSKVIEDYQQLEQQLSEKTQQIEQLQEVHTKLTKEFQQLEKQNAEISEQFEQNKQLNMKLNQDLVQLENVSNQQNIELEKQKDLNIQLTIEMEELKKQQDQELEELRKQQDEELEKQDEIIENLNQDYQKLNEQFNQQTIQIRNLQETNVQLEQKHQEFLDEVEETQQQNQEFQKIISQLKTQLQEKDKLIEKQIQEQNKIEQLLNNQILQFKKEIQILKEIQLTENQNQITELTLQIQNLQNDKEIQLEQVEQNYIQVIEQLKQGFQQKEVEFKLQTQELSNEIQQLEQGVLKLQRDAEEQQKELIIMEENKEALQYEADQMKTGYEVQLEEQLLKIQQLEENIKAKNQQIQQMEKQIEQAQADIEEQENTIFNQDELVQQLKQKEEERIKEIEIKEAKLQQDINVLKQQNEELLNVKQQLESQLKEQQAQLLNTKVELNQMTQKLLLKDQEMEQANLELRGVEQSEKELMIFELKADLEQKEFDLQQQNEDFMKQQNVLFEIITQKDQEANQIVAQKDQEVNELRESLNDHAQRLSEASKVIEKYSTCNAELQSTLDQLNTQIAKQQQLINELQSKGDVATQAQEEKIRQLNEIIIQQDVDFARVEEKTKQTQEVKQQFDKKAKEFEKERQALQEEIRTKEQQLQTLESKLQTSQREKEQINNQLKTATKDFLQQLSVSNQGIEEQKIWVIHYKKEVDKLNKEVALAQQISQQYNSQRNELDQIRLENQKIHKMLDSAQQQMNQQKRELDQLKQEKNKQSELTKMNEERLLEMEELKLEKQKIQTKLNDAQRALNESQQKLQSQQNQYQQMQDDLQLSKKEIQDIKQKNKALAQQQQTEIAKFNDEILRIQEELEQSRKIQMEIKKAEQESKDVNAQMKSNNEKLKNENNILKNHLDDVQNEIEECRQEMQEKEELVEKLQDQLKYKQQQVESQSTIINQVEQNKLNQTNQILQQSNQLTNLSKELFALKQQLQINDTQNESYKREVERLRREFEFQVKQVEDYKQQNKKLQQQLDFEKKHNQKQKVYEASELLSKIDSTLSPIKGTRMGSTLYGSSDSKMQQKLLQQRTPQKEYGIQNSNSASMLNTSFQSQDQLAKENKKLKASLEQKMKIIEQLEQALIQSEQTLKEVHEKANQFCQQQENEIKQIKEQYQRLEQEHNTILAEREYENQQISKQKEQALFKVQILQDEVLKSKRGSIASQHVASSKYSETLQDISIREVPSSSHRYRQSDGQFKSYFGTDSQAKLIYDTQKLLLENQKLNGQMCKLYQILGLDKSRAQKLGDGEKIIQSVQLLLQEVIDCKQEIQNLIQAQPARSLKYQSMEKELLQTKQKYYAVEKSPKFWNNETPKARFFNYSNSSGK